MSARLLVTLSGVLAALCMGGALRVAADPGRLESLRAESARLSAMQEQREAERLAWQSEYRGLLADYQAASERAAQAQYDWQKLRSRLRDQGTPRIEARQEIEASHEALAEATSAIREFHERTRQQDVPPGWLSRVEEEFPEIASAVASR